MPSDRTGVRERVREYLATYSWAADTRTTDSLGNDDDVLFVGDLRALLSALDAAEAERDRLREDAARLDWLERAVPSGEFRDAVERTIGAHMPFPFNIRAALDAAREGR